MDMIWEILSEDSERRLQAEAKRERPPTDAALLFKASHTIDQGGAKQTLVRGVVIKLL